MVTPCQDCDGTGLRTTGRGYCSEEGQVFPCMECDGTGQVVDDRDTEPAPPPDPDEDAQAAENVRNLELTLAIVKATSW